MYLLCTETKHPTKCHRDTCKANRMRSFEWYTEYSCFQVKHPNIESTSPQLTMLQWVNTHSCRMNIEDLGSNEKPENNYTLIHQLQACFSTTRKALLKWGNKSSCSKLFRNYRYPRKTIDDSLLGII